MKIFACLSSTRCQYAPSCVVHPWTKKWPPHHVLLHGLAWAQIIGTSTTGQRDNLGLDMSSQTSLYPYIKHQVTLIQSHQTNTRINTYQTYGCHFKKQTNGKRKTPHFVVVARSKRTECEFESLSNESIVHCGICMIMILKPEGYVMTSSRHQTLATCNLRL